MQVYGFLVADPDTRGLRFRDLGSRDAVLSRGTLGNVGFTDCQAANILFNNHYEGTVKVEGTEGERTGLTAFQFALLEICDPCLWIKDNNSLVMTDFYNEQCRSLYRFDGNGSPQRGRLSLGSIKVEQVPRTLTGYKGEITCGHPQYYCNNLNGKSYFNNDADCDIDYLEMAGYYYVHSMRWNDNGGFRARFLAAGGSPADDLSREEFAARTSDTPDEQAIAQAGRFFDDMRRVGELDMLLNYPGICDILWEE